MNDDEARKQIRQMCAFILQEATEKATEIKIRVCLAMPPPARNRIRCARAAHLCQCVRPQSSYPYDLIHALRACLYLCSPVQTEHDFNLDKQTLVHKGRLRLEEEFAKKVKDLEVQKRM